MHPHDLPPQLSPDSTNALATPGSLGKRPGTASAATGLPSGTNVVGMNVLETAPMLAANMGRLTAVTSDGKVSWEMTPSVDPVFSVSVQLFQPVQRATMASDEGRLFVCPTVDGKRNNEHGIYFKKGQDSGSIIGPDHRYGPMFRPPCQAPPTLIDQNSAGGVVTAGTHYVVLVPLFADGTTGAASAAGNVTVVAGTRKIQVNPGANLVDPMLMDTLVYCTTAGGGIYYLVGYASSLADPGFGGNIIINVSDAYIGAQARLDYPDNLALRYTPLSPSAAFAISGQRLALVNCRTDYGFPTGGLLNHFFYWTTGGVNPYGWNLGAGATTTNNGQAGKPCIRITGDGVSASRGLCSNNGDLALHVGGPNGPGGSGGSADLNAVQLGNVSMLCRVRRSAGMTGTFVVQVSATGYGTMQASVNAASAIGTTWSTIEIPIPYDVSSFTGSMALSFFAGGTPPNNEWLEVDFIDPIYIGSKTDGNTIHYSQSNFQMNFNDGESQCVVGSTAADEVRSVFQLFGRHFVAKMHSLWEIIENQDVPSTWTPRIVTDKTGTLSYAGVGLGPNFAIIAGQEGCWFFQGAPLSLDSNLAWEILPDWNAINWAYGHLIWCHVIPEDKLVLIGVPTNGATEVNAVWALSYLEGWERGDQNPGKGRKWFTWTLAAASFFATNRSDGKLMRLLGNNDASAKIRKLDSTLVNDEGSAMSWSYETGRFYVSPKLNTLERISVDAHGTGQLAVAVRDNQENLTGLGAMTLYDPTRGQSRFHTRKVSEKFGFVFSMSAVDDAPTLDRVEPVIYPYRHMGSRLLNP